MSTTKEPSLCNVIDIYCKSALASAENRVETEKSVRTFVADMQQKRAPTVSIYKGLATLCPLTGCPLKYYGTLRAEKENKAATAAQKRVNKQEVSEATVRAQSELSNKRKCIALETNVRDKQSKISQLTTATAKLSKTSRIFGDIGPGCYAEVKEDLSPGKCSHGGRGYVVAIEGEGATKTFSVKYNQCATAGMSVERGVTYSRVTELDCPLSGLKPSSARNRRPPSNFGKENVPPRPRAPTENLPLYAVLSIAHARNRGKGWRAKDLSVAPASNSVPKSDSFKSLMLQDAREMCLYLHVNPEADKYLKQNSASGTLSKRSTKFNPPSWKYMNHAWDVGKNTINRMLKAQPNNDADSNKDPKKVARKYY